MRALRLQLHDRFIAIAASLVVYAISFFLMRLLSRYRELCADRAGAYLTMRPQALASALQKISGEMAAIPQRDLRATQAMNAFFIAPVAITKDNLDVVIDAGWVSKDVVCQGVAAGSVAACD